MVGNGNLNHMHEDMGRRYIHGIINFHISRPDCLFGAHRMSLIDDNRNLVEITTSHRRFIYYI